MEINFIRKNCLVVIALFFIFTASFQLYAVEVGDKGTALWHGKDYPAEITKVNGDSCFVHWTGESGAFDEWQPCKDITIAGSKNTASTTAVAGGVSYKEGDSVSVEWNGKWYPAHVLEVNAAKKSYKIHYDGYSASWDEWVNVGRIKK